MNNLFCTNHSQLTALQSLGLFILSPLEVSQIITLVSFLGSLCAEHLSPLICPHSPLHMLLYYCIVAHHLVGFKNIKIIYTIPTYIQKKNKISILLCTYI